MKTLLATILIFYTLVAYDNCWLQIGWAKDFKLTHPNHCKHNNHEHE